MSSVQYFARVVCTAVLLASFQDVRSRLPNEMFECPQKNEGNGAFLECKPSKSNVPLAMSIPFCDLSKEGAAPVPDRNWIASRKITYSVTFHSFNSLFIHLLIHGEGSAADGTVGGGGGGFGSATCSKKSI